MRVKSLQLANVRGIEAAEFRFRPGFNLIVGENGIGKTTVLDALRFCLTAFVRSANGIDIRGAFAAEDVRVGADALTVGCVGSIGMAEHRYVIHRPHESVVSREGKAGMPREHVIRTPAKRHFLGPAPTPATGREPEGRPLAVLYSTKRAVTSYSTRSPAAGSVEAAFAAALADAALRLGVFADWMRAQEALAREWPPAGRVLEGLEKAIARFLPGYARLRVDPGKRMGLVIDRDGSTVSVHQLSDGERGVLCLALDLTRRLVQANPELENPVEKAEAVVLIDELELHLHPRWQRRIAARLTKTFPSCQFIATTHSPQVIGEVQHDRVHIMTDGEVYSPNHSFGVDSSRVLEEVMQVVPRNEGIEQLLGEVSDDIGEQQYARARESIGKLARRIGEDDPEITRMRTLLDFMEGDA